MERKFTRYFWAHQLSFRCRLEYWHCSPSFQLDLRSPWCLPSLLVLLAGQFSHRLSYFCSCGSQYWLHADFLCWVLQFQTSEFPMNNLCAFKSLLGLYFIEELFLSWICQDEKRLLCSQSQAFYWYHPTKFDSLNN